MRSIGFSTGALALGDFDRGLSLISDRHTKAIELSALREKELPGLMSALDRLHLEGYQYISVHAPSRLQTMKESVVADLLRPCIERKWSVVLHPDAIGDHGCWRDFGRFICIENMDKRKEAGRTATELRRHFQELPDASMCLDLAHARQVDPTLGIARDMIREYGERIVQLHLSELDVNSHHEPLSMAAVWAIREIAHLLPQCPVILESMVQPDAIDSELEMAIRCFESNRRADPAGTSSAPGGSRAAREFASVPARSDG
jgi:hypothetical protein